MSKTNGSVHPFLKKDPKPTRARLVSLLDPLGRKRYGEVERFLATINGATSGLHFFENGWGWAVRYTLGSKEPLCTIHLLPNSFEATVPVNADALGGAELSSDLRRRISRAKTASGARQVRLPLRSDLDYLNFQALAKLKAEQVRIKNETKKAKPAKAAAADAAPAAKKSAKK